MAQNTQQFSARESQITMVNEIGSNSSVESQLSHITTMLNKISLGEYRTQSFMEFVV